MDGGFVLPNDTLLIGFDFTNKDAGYLIVAKKKMDDEHLQIINAFQGEEAYELYLHLTKAKGEDK